MDPISANQGLISHVCHPLGTGNYVPALAEEQEESVVLRGMSAGSKEPLWPGWGHPWFPSPFFLLQKALAALCPVHNVPILYRSPTRKHDLTEVLHGTAL